MSRRAWAAMGGALILALAIGIAIGALLTRGQDHNTRQTDIAAAVNRALASTTTSTTSAPTTTPPSPPTTSPASTTVAPTTTSPPPLTFGPGIYQVGVDIPSGVYRTTDEDCYWAKLNSNNPDDVTDFDYGASSVTVDSPWFRIAIANNARYNRCILTKTG